MPHPPESEEHFRCVAAWAERLKSRVFLLLGNECAHCGYKDQRALQIDHIKGYSGTRKASWRSGTGLYCAILSGKVPFTECQMLCANCNVLKRLEAGEHQLSRKNPGKPRFSRSVFITASEFGSFDKSNRTPARFS